MSRSVASAEEATRWTSSVSSMARMRSRTWAARSYSCRAAASAIWARRRSTRSSVLPRRNITTWSISRPYSSSVTSEQHGAEHLPIWP